MTWQTKSLGDVAPLKYGKGLSKKQRVPGPYAVYGSNGIVGSHTEALVKGACIVVGRKGSVGEVHFAPAGAWPIDTTFYVQPADDHDIYFVYYLLKQAGLQRLNSDSAVPGLNRQTAEAVNVGVPPLAEQRRIAAFLRAIDNKIQHNDASISRIERFGRSMWDMKFAEANPEPLENQLGVIETGSRPKGGVGGIAEGVPSVGAESVKSLATFDFRKVKHVPLDYFQSMRRGHVVDRDVLVYKDGGRPGQFEPHVAMWGEGFPFNQFCINEHVYRLRASEGISQEYLYFGLTSASALEEMRRRGTGVAIPGLNSTSLKGLPMPIPTADGHAAFVAAVGPLVTRALRLASESQRLASLRDSLLPSLLSNASILGEG